MNPTVISETIQEFMGEKYYLCVDKAIGRPGTGYFRRCGKSSGKLLHRVVWEHAHGKAPKGFHVHHKDENRANNALDNLELMSAGEHSRMHCLAEIEVRRERFIRTAIPAARAWHSTPEGLAWHSANGKRAWEMRAVHTVVCSHCAKTFESKIAQEGNRKTRWCSPLCKTRNRVARLRSASSPAQSK